MPIKVSAVPSEPISYYLIEKKMLYNTNSKQINAFNR